MSCLQLNGIEISSTWEGTANITSCMVVKNSAAHAAKTCRRGDKLVLVFLSSLMLVSSLWQSPHITLLIFAWLQNEVADAYKGRITTGLWGNLALLCKAWAKQMMLLHLKGDSWVTAFLTCHHRHACLKSNCALNTEDRGIASVSQKIFTMHELCSLLQISWHADGMHFNLHFSQRTARKSLLRKNDSGNIKRNHT